VIKSRRLRWAGHVARVEEGRGAYRVLVRKETTWKTRRTWEDDIKMDLREAKWGGSMDWIDMA
jgi:hypothetical protein